MGNSLAGPEDFCFQLTAEEKRVGTTRINMISLSIYWLLQPNEDCRSMLHHRNTNEPAGGKNINKIGQIHARSTRAGRGPRTILGTTPLAVRSG
jgi:hypothetical protein